jgi:hypothetical protein
VGDGRHIVPRKDDVTVDRSLADDPMAATGGAELERRAETGATRRPATKGTLERGWVKHRLIRDLAIAEKSQRELAAIYGVSTNSITNFKKRYALEVEEVRNNLADEYASLWIGQKMKRIAEYQEAAEKMAQGKTPRNAEVLVSILKAVAEELGQLPARTQVNVSTETTVYEIVGLDPEDI